MFRVANTVVVGFIALLWLGGCDATAPGGGAARSVEQVLKDSIWIGESNTHHLEILKGKLILTTFDKGSDSAAVLSGAALDDRRIIVENNGQPVFMAELDEEGGLVVTSLGRAEKTTFERLSRHSSDQLLGHWYSAQEEGTVAVTMRPGEMDLQPFWFDHQNKTYMTDGVTTREYRLINGHKIVANDVNEKVDDNNVVYVVAVDEHGITYSDNRGSRWTERRYSGDTAELIPDGYKQIPLPE